MEAKQDRFTTRWAGPVAGLAAATFMLSGCAILPRNGPTTRSLYSEKFQNVDSVPVQIIEVDQKIARRLVNLERPASFASVFGDGDAVGMVIGRGDVLEISIWEAPPAVLFGTSAGVAEFGGVSRATQLPAQTVDPDGMITVPFAGSLRAAGRSTSQIAADIRARLVNQAHDPQVIVSRSENATSGVTVVGEVNRSLRMPLSARGERLLDALAAAGGSTKPVEKMTVQITRADVVEAMPLEAVIREPRQNVMLQPNDVVTLLYQPYSFVTLGAAGRSQEFQFESTGLTLSQALGRMGGLQDSRADPKGVFIFRFENPRLFTDAGMPAPRTTEDGKVPVIYRVNLRDPSTLFAAQSFPIRDGDVMFISNAPLAEFQKFLQALSQIVYPIATIQNANIF